MNRPVKRHKSPLHLLFLTTAVKPRPYETILTTRRHRNYNMKANITIKEDRPTAIQDATNTTSTIIYTDGSGFEHGIGVAAILMKNGNTIDSRRYYLGPDSCHTVYEAEAMAIILALHMACELKKKLKKLTIGTDNQAVLYGLLNQKSSHYLLDKVHDLLDDLQVLQARLRGKHVVGYRKGAGRTLLKDGSLGWKEWRLKTTCDVTFIWTPGHEGIEGNEKADTEAKRAAQGDSSPHPTLPTIIRRKALSGLWFSRPIFHFLFCLTHFTFVNFSLSL